MSLFNKLNQIKDLKTRAKNLQDQLAQESVSLEKHGLSLVMNGNQKITKLDINPELLAPARKARLEELIVDLQNEAIGKVQRLMAEKMRSLGDFNLPGLK
ncbi:MAG TPA: YbaB/EbfC family nucleoid-associated protein [Patescibacteria group bacterium]|nr:YbaB/EbfC family nucleoid-associated protein [Patescibacteria group bacterium]